MYVTYNDLFTFVMMLCAIFTLIFMHKNSALNRGK